MHITRNYAALTDSHGEVERVFTAIWCPELGIDSPSVEVCRTTAKPTKKRTAKPRETAQLELF